MADTEVITIEETHAPDTGIVLRPDSIFTRSRHSFERKTPYAKNGPNLEEIELTDLSQPIEAPGASKDVETETIRAPRWLPHLQMFSLCWAFYTAGWNDATTGTLLPRIQSNYQVGYTVVSLVFISNFLGFLVGAIVNIHIVEKLGFGIAMAIGSSATVIGYCLQAPAPPFPVFVLSYSIVGFGLALQEAGANSYVASLKKSGATKMGILHAVYGAGGLCSPLSATQFAHMQRWSFQYLISLCVAVVNVLMIVTVFRFKRQEDCLQEIGQAPDPATSELHDGNKYRQVFRLKELHLLAFFILIYVGASASIGGWTVTYLINVRGGGPSTGYISSGYSAGIMLGRVGLLWINKKVGELRAIFLYTVLAIGLELVVWLVPSLAGDAIAVSFIGFVTGPIFPLVMRHATKIIPPYLLAGSIGWIAGFGQAGSAFVPFMAGAIASRWGIKSLQPMVVCMMGLMLCFGAVIPRSRRLD